MFSITTLFPFSLLHSVEILIAGFLLYYGAWIIYSRFFHPYHDIPGPFAASITQWRYFRSIRYGIAENIQLPLHKKYGRMVRIGPDDVSIMDATALDTIYGLDPIWEKTEFYDSFNPRIGDRTDIFTERDEKIHTIQRKKTGSLFTLGAVLEYEPCIDRIIDIFCRCMEDIASSGEIVDVSIWFRRYSFDVIGEMFYGKEGGFGFMKDNKDVNNWMSMLDGMVPIVSSLGYIPKGMKTLYLMSQLIFPAVRKGLSSANLVVEQSKAVVKEREAAEAAGTVSSRHDYLSKLMNLVREKGEKIDFNNLDVAVYVWMMIWAGSDTTGYAITGIIYHTLRNPKVYKKLVGEIQEAFASGNLTFPIRYNDAYKLPYLRAVIQEGMRISPSFGTGLPRYVPKGGATIAGRYFPEGYKVTCNQNAVHFDKECFGEDAEEFVPERWLREDEARTRYMARHDMGFGLGPRNCLGKNVGDPSARSSIVLTNICSQISLVEMHKLIPAILHKYDFELTASEWKVVNGWFRCPSDVKVKVTRR